MIQTVHPSFLLTYGCTTRIKSQNEGTFDCTQDPPQPQDYTEDTRLISRWTIFDDFDHDTSNTTDRIFSILRHLQYQRPWISLRGHLKSLILWPIESAHATSYWSSIVTFVLSCRVSEILELLYAESHCFLHPPLFRRKIGGVLIWLYPRCWGLQRANTPG